MDEQITLTLVQSQGPDGRYAKLKVHGPDGETTIALSHEQLGRLISGIAIEATGHRSTRR